jgi:hypothetical protein
MWRPRTMPGSESITFCCVILRVCPKASSTGFCGPGRYGSIRAGSRRPTGYRLGIGCGSRPFAGIMQIPASPRIS